MMANLSTAAEFRMRKLEAVIDSSKWSVGWRLTTAWKTYIAKKFLS